MTEAVRRQIEEAKKTPHKNTTAAGKGLSPAGGSGASRRKKTTTPEPVTPPPSPEQTQKQQRAAKARPLFGSTTWDEGEETECYRWVAHGLSLAQKEYLDAAALACGIRPAS